MRRGGCMRVITPTAQLLGAGLPARPPLDVPAEAAHCCLHDPVVAPPKQRVCVACRRAHSALHDLEAPPHVGQRALTVWLEPELAAPPEVAAKLNAYKLAVRNLAHNDVEQHPEPVA